jgi:hypothetical protein
VTLDVGFGEGVLELVRSQGDIEGFWQLAQAAPSGLTQVRKDGAPIDLFIHRVGKVVEIGTRHDLMKLWELDEAQWDELLTTLTPPER